MPSLTTPETATRKHISAVTSSAGKERQRMRSAAASDGGQIQSSVRACERSQRSCAALIVATSAAIAWAASCSASMVRSRLRRS